ncbi:DUF222 domain-containing protein [Nocardioides gansuensis]|uniref:DUF222 domain-containing protein n=2 Tax=Nocardioides gansuensis TaxID=2138300 RepID=A0A2T8F690_9ACTN|nr:DUF222 domain-containing protein [Nocardioides gansuensis]
MTRGADDLSAAELLAALGERKAAEDRAAAEQLDLAARWADLHPPESIHDAATFTLPGLEHEEAIAGPGCPLVAAFCIAELGATLGISTQAAKRLIGNALELRHRLPKLWAHVHAGRVPAWRARQVAEATTHATPALPLQGARWVDTQVAGFAAKIGPAQLDRLVAEAIQRFVQATLPEDPDDQQPPCPDTRGVSFDFDQVGYPGTIRMEGELDLADALDLDHALRHGAEQLKALGSTDPLGARRARALGEIARHQQVLDLAGARPARQAHGTPEGQEASGTGATTTTGHDASTSGRGSGPRLPAARRLDLHIHLSAAALGEDGAATLESTGRLDQRQQLVLLEQVKAWCADTHTDVRITPVVDLDAEIHTPGYEPTPRQREQVQLRDQTCYFPWCSRPATRCDLDHVVPYDHDAAAEGREQPGPTTSANLAPACRAHHRLKTHGRWRVLVLAAGVYLWISPHGQPYLRDRTGTTALPLPSHHVHRR